MTRSITRAAIVLIGALSLTSACLAEPNTAGDEEGTLYERVGGLMPISVVVSDFLDALIPDPQLNSNPAIDAARKRVPAPYLKYQVTAFVCMATGGPCDYTGRGMSESHAHMNITGQEWERMMTIFKEVLARHQVPEEETRELVELLDTTRDAIVTAS